MALSILGFIVLLSQHVGPLPETPMTMNDYPPLARQARLQGVARLNLTVEGSCDNAKVVVVSAHPLLVRAALAHLTRYQAELCAAGIRKVNYHYILKEEFDIQERVVELKVHTRPNLFRRVFLGEKPTTRMVRTVERVPVKRSGVPSFERKHDGDMLELILTAPIPQLQTMSAVAD